MHSYGEIIVDVNTMMTLDLNVDLYVDLHADLQTVHYGKLGDKLRPGLNAYSSIDFNGDIKKCIKSELEVI